MSSNCDNTDFVLS